MFTTISESFIAIGWRCVLLYGTHTHTQTHTNTLIFIYRLSFQNYLEHVYKKVRKLRRNRMNVVCSCKATPDTPASTIFNFLKFLKPPRACFQQLVKFQRNRMNALCSCRATLGTPTSTIVILFLISKNHREHVYNNFWKFHRNRMNGVCSCKATPGTPGGRIFKFPKPPRVCSW